MFESGRIILKAELTNTTPIGIASGLDERSDRDVILTLYPVNKQGKIISFDEITGDEDFVELPYIPATSFMGKISTYLDFEQNIPKIMWGNFVPEAEFESSSLIDCSDLIISSLPDKSSDSALLNTEIRDGVMIDSNTGLAIHKGKFDYELIVPGTTFSLTMIFVVDSRNKNSAGYNGVLQLASTIAEIIESGFKIGAKSSSGFGNIKGKAKIFGLDFSIDNQFSNWISKDLERYEVKRVEATFLRKKPVLFEINASFRIKTSLIIRSYSKLSDEPDSTHLKSGGINILSGTSIRGVLKSRAERILNTLNDNSDITDLILMSLFGDVRENIDGPKYIIPSRVFIDELPVINVNENLQTRIQIDRFTGGTVDGALIDELPLSSNSISFNEHNVNLSIKVVGATSLDKGIMLLLLKDLWLSDLPIGGEKAIGRGVLEGKNALIKDEGTTYELPKLFDKLDKMEKLESYVNTLANAGVQKEYYNNYLDKFLKQ